MNSYSQAGQDKWVYEMSGHKFDGTFLDVGCHDGKVHSNTLGLEQLGWRGLLVDIQYVDPISERLSEIWIGDALNIDWSDLLKKFFPRESFIDYLSLDVDECTTAALEKIIATPYKFGFITSEHDFYRLGAGPMTEQRRILFDKGYKLHTSNVEVGPGPWGEGGSYEDWWRL